MSNALEGEEGFIHWQKSALLEKPLFLITPQFFFLPLSLFLPLWVPNQGVGSRLFSSSRCHSLLLRIGKKAPLLPLESDASILLRSLRQLLARGLPIPGGSLMCERALLRRTVHLVRIAIHDLPMCPLTQLALWSAALLFQMHSPFLLSMPRGGEPEPFSRPNPG